MTSLEEGTALLQAVKYDIVQVTRGVGIDIGRGPMKPYRHFIAVREKGDELMGDTRPDLQVESFAKLGDSFKEGSLDFVFAWGDVDFDEAAVIPLLREGGKIVYARDADSVSFGEKRDGAWFVPRPPRRQEKTVCIVRYGAIGDALQSASILPELKRQGYHVTWMCEPIGEKVLRHDPHIDAFMVQDPDQVPNQELPLYFDHWKRKFDKWINLCESVEGTLICLPGRAKYEFPKAVRHKLCDHNYLEFIGDLAEIPFHPEHHFYPSADEHCAALKILHDIVEAANKDWVIGQKYVKPYVIMWALSGSGVHKFYPHQDNVIAKIMTDIPEAHVVMVGDEVCKILEVGWENESRVHRLSGELPLRTTLALAQKCDMVIGPETGVLNSVAFESMPKVVFLSHSTEENLTKHWINTTALSSMVTPCYPCHQLHEDRRVCPQDPGSGAAMCQYDIPPSTAWRAVWEAYDSTRSVIQLLETA